MAVGCTLRSISALLCNDQAEILAKADCAPDAALEEATHMTWGPTAHSSNKVQDVAGGRPYRGPEAYQRPWYKLMR